MVQPNTKPFGNLILVSKNIRKTIITTISNRKTILIKNMGRWLYHNVRHCAFWSTCCALCIMFTRPALGAREPCQSGVPIWRRNAREAHRGVTATEILLSKYRALLWWSLLHCTASPPTHWPRRGKGGRYEAAVTGSPGNSLAKHLRGCTRCKDVICLWNHPHCLAEMSKVDTTRERLLWCISRQKATGWTDVMTHKTHNCFETNSFLCKKEGEKKKICLFILSLHWA